MSDLVVFLTARYDETEALEDPHAVWQLDHDGYGRTLHATPDHAKAEAERREPDGGTYWRWDDDKYWLKRDGETIATIERAPVLGRDPGRVLADIAAKREIVYGYQVVLANNAIEDATQLDEHAELKAALRTLVIQTLWMTLRQLAAPYAEHPDFDEAWRIDG